VNPKLTTLATLKRVGGNPALDFVNTVHHWRGEGPSRDYLLDYADLLRWSFDSGVLDASERRVLVHKAQVECAAAIRAHREALTFREVVHDVFLAASTRRAPDAARMLALNAWGQRAAKHRIVVTASDGRLSPSWGFDTDALPLEFPVLKLALAAIEFAFAAEPARLKECPAVPGCGWLFYDSSKNCSRRWCDMGDCGNLAKSRRHYARVRAKH
jgi:predicted RNA-binding Zn ribbon-like protein